MVRNDGTSNDKKYLGMKNEGYNPSGQIWYEEYCSSAKNGQIFEKKAQLWIRLDTVSHILVRKLLYQQGYTLVRDAYWIDMLK